MNFLKKLGTIIANVAGIAVGIGPLIQPFLGSAKVGVAASTGTNDLLAIAQLVLQAEAMMQSTPGPQRMSAVLPLITNVIKTSELVAGKKIADEAAFNKGCQEIAQGVFDVLSGIHGDEAKTA